MTTTELVRSVRLWVASLQVTSLPVGHALLWGQPTTLLACAVAESYRCLRAGKNFQAGLWLAYLLLKPRYMHLIGPVLAWKRRHIHGAVLLAMPVAAVLPDERVARFTGATIKAGVFLLGLLFLASFGYPFPANLLLALLIVASLICLCWELVSGRRDSAENHEVLGCRAVVGASR